MQPMLRIAIKAARSAGKIIDRAFRDVDVLPIEKKPQMILLPPSTGLLKKP